jgi:hypothetical protein
MKSDAWCCPSWLCYVMLIFSFFVIPAIAETIRRRRTRRFLMVVRGRLKRAQDDAAGRGGGNLQSTDLSKFAS